MNNGRELLTAIAATPPRESAAGRPVVVFLPGMSGNNRQWDLVIKQLLADGESDGDGGSGSEPAPSLAYGAPVLAHQAFDGARPTVVRLGQAMAQELADRQYGPVVIVTHSVGAFTGLAIAHAAPDKVKALIIVNGGLTSVARFIDSPLRQLFKHPSSSFTYLRLFALVGAPVPGALKKAIARRRWASRAVVGNLVSDSALASQEQRESLLTEAGKSETMLALWKNRHHWHEMEGYAAEVGADVHFLVGSSDPMTTEKDTRYMASLLPHAEVTVLKGVGHAAPLEAAETVTAAIRDALRPAADSSEEE
ncbi:alpha/beta fold hydrolase [Actinacidiphila alni]|uniref:alpha/beta fold hydrolase n=1 Tax=Actinacidiphila alni TaxID=380248 RepID=UPI003453D31A